MEDPRVAQFRKMTESDPDNELGHFSLGKTCLEIGDYRQAVASLRRTIELSPQNSKAYYLLAMAQKGAQDVAGAADTLRRGYEVATARGDMMPRKDIITMMKTLGLPLPAGAEDAVAAPAAGSADASPAGASTITCRRCGQARPKMTERPFKGPLGERIWAEICQPCWKEWIPMGTKVINELRLNFADPRHAETYDHYMKEFLGLD